MPQDAAALQQALLPRYTLLGQIGRGGMATVYLAEDRERGERVAVKVLDAESASSIDPTRFAREIGIVASLEHPAILPLLDSGSRDGFLYLVLPYVSGGSLRQMLDRDHQIPLENALGIVRAVAAALDHAHHHGVVHRDVKPENILLDGDEVFLADFGVARVLSGAHSDRITATGQSVGTPAYASPEQAGGDPRLDWRTDLYSLGCVLFEMLAGEPPFTGSTPQAVIARQIGAAAPSLDVVRPDLPPAVAAAVARALAKAPPDRFASGQAFVGALEADAPPRGWTAHRASPWKWAAAAAITFAVGVSGLMIGRPWASRSFLDPHKVVVLPLASTSGIADPTAGWEVALAVGGALEHTEPLKFIDGWAWLDEAARKNPAAVTAAVAREVARSRGARYYIAGAIRGDAAAPGVVLRLHDVEGDSLVAQESAEGGIDGRPRSAAQLGLAAVIPLLARLVEPNRSIDLTSLTRRTPAAIALWLQGERSYRQARFDEALDLTERAVAADSLLVFAAVKGAEAANWASRFDESERMIRVALRHDTLLPPKYVHFARGIAAYFDGDADAAVDELRRALTLDPGWSEAATALGEVHYHLMPADQDDADSAAATRLGAAWAGDTTFTPPLFHLAEIALRDGDDARAAALTDRWRKVAPDTILLAQLDMSLACVRAHRPSAFDWSDFVERSPRAALQAGLSLAGRAARVACAEGAFRAVLASRLDLAWRWTALRGLVGLEMAMGRTAAVDSLLTAQIEGGFTEARPLYVYAALAGAPFGTEANRVDSVAVDAWGTSFAGADPEYHWLLSLWRSASGKPERASALRASLTELVDQQATPCASAMRSGADAFEAVARADTARALELLDGLEPRAGRNWIEFESECGLAPEHLLRGELLLARGDARGAWRSAAHVDHPAPIVNLIFLRRSLELRLEAARAMGSDARAAAIMYRLNSLAPPMPPP